MKTHGYIAAGIAAVFATCTDIGTGPYRARVPVAEKPAVYAASEGLTDPYLSLERGEQEIKVEDGFDPGRRAFFRGEDAKAREEFKKDGIAPWEAPFLYLLDSPFRETYPDYWPLMQGRTPSGKYILYSDAGAPYLPEAKESGWKHTEEWEIIADLIDREAEEYAKVLGQPPNDGFVGRVYFFTDRKFRKPFEQAIGAPQDNAPGRYSPIHRIVYSAPEGEKVPGIQQVDFSTLFHEATHQYLRRLVPNPPPWFDEGIATVFGRYRADVENRKIIPTPGADKKGWIDERMLKMLEADDKSHAQDPAPATRYVHDFRTLMTMDFGRFHEFRSPRDNQGNQYCQSAAILRYLLEDHSTNTRLKKAGGGRAIFDRFLSGYKKNRPWEEVFEKTFEGADIAELEEEFSAFVRNEFR